MRKITPSTLSLHPTICVFCGSSHGADPIYTEAARAFGGQMVEAGFDLVFGGGGVGLMGEVALSVNRSGGQILGVIPNFLRHVEPPLRVASQIVVTESMNDRKAKMTAAAGGFAVLPGGLGTLDEFAEVLTGAQLRLHNKPIVLVNIRNYFAPLVALLEHFIAEGFAGAHVAELYHLAPTVEDAIAIFRADRDRRKTRAPADGGRALQAGAPSR
ncbi:MAG TPA: TIGR00730 family Rossman fold protein [Micropepsaceae bacterium]|nr:TIGR00730 family Rossman fold protein [Micropepsaceae bacterium]